MLAKLKIIQVGNCLGTKISKEIAAALKVEKGDTLFITAAPGGGYRLTPYDPDFEAQMERARTIMKKRQNALRRV